MPAARRLNFMARGVGGHGGVGGGDNLLPPVAFSLRAGDDDAGDDCTTPPPLTMAEGDGLLSQADLAEYSRDGLVVPRFHLAPAAVAALQVAVEETLEVTCAADPAVEMPVAPHCPTNLYAGHGHPIPESLAAVWMSLARHPIVLGLVRSILGPDIILWGAQLFHKRARTGLEVPWHQDGRYWPIHPPATCSVWVAIDAADSENGVCHVYLRSEPALHLSPPKCHPIVCD